MRVCVRVCSLGSSELLGGVGVKQAGSSFWVLKAIDLASTGVGMAMDNSFRGVLLHIVHSSRLDGWLDRTNSS